MEQLIRQIENDELRTSKVSIRECYKATATVGRDVIEAEYYIFDHSSFWEPKEMKWFEKIWDVITTPYYKAKWWLKETYWEVRYGFERMFKGYDSVDTFETFAKFIERYTKILTEYRKTHIGYVWDMSEEEWDNIIDEMLYHLHYMDEETVAAELEKDVPDNWNVSAKTVSDILDKHKDEFFKLFSKYFYNLWD